MMITKIDLAFRVMCNESIPCDHGYALFGAISRILPSAHESDALGVMPIAGSVVGNRQMQLVDRSRLVLRIPTVDIASYLPLSGKKLNVDGFTLQVGVPEVRTLIPASAVRSRLVTTKNCLDTARFEAELKRQLSAIDVSGEAVLSIGKRRTIRIRDKEILGYEVVIEQLSSDESLVIQSQGLGGRRHMGCGIFVVHRPVPYVIPNKVSRNERGDTGNE
jgi:CRISPR-associated protein Cas6